MDKKLEILQRNIKIAFLRKTVRIMAENEEVTHSDLITKVGIPEKEFDVLLPLLRKYYKEIEKESGKAYQLNEAATSLATISNNFYMDLPGFESVRIFEKEIESLVSDNFLEMVFKELDKIIEGETWNKRAMFLIFCSAYLKRKDKIHPRPAGPSAVGKSFAMFKILDLFPPEDIVIKATSISPKYLQHRLQGQNLDGKIIAVVEFSGAEEALITVKPMMSGDIEGITAGIVDNLKAVELKSKGVPIFATSSTKISLDPEFESRSYKLEMNDSKEQTGKVMLFEADEDIVPEKHTSDEVGLIRNCLRILREVGMKDIRVLYGRELARGYPHENVIMRRLFKMLKSFAKIVTFVNQFIRPRLIDETHTFAILSTFQDYETIFPIIQNTFEIAYTRGSRNLDKTYRACKELSDSGERITTKSVARKLGLSQNTAGVYLNNLVNMGRLDIDTDPDDRRRNIYELRGFELADIPLIRHLRTSFTQNKLKNILNEISEYHNPLKIEYNLEEISIEKLYSLLISHAVTYSDIQTKTENNSKQEQEGRKSVNHAKSGSSIILKQMSKPGLKQMSN